MALLGGGHNASASRSQGKGSAAVGCDRARAGRMHAASAAPRRAVAVSAPRFPAGKSSRGSLACGVSTSRKHTHSATAIHEAGEELLFEGVGPAGGSGREALEKARHVADLAREAARLAEVAASLEHSVVLPSAAESRMREAQGREARRRVDVKQWRQGNKAGFKVSAVVSEELPALFGEIRTLDAARNADVVGGEPSQRQAHARRERRQRWRAGARRGRDDARDSGGLREEVSCAGGDMSLDFDLLTADEEKELAGKIKDLCFLERCYEEAKEKRARNGTAAEGDEAELDSVSGEEWSLEVFGHEDVPALKERYLEGLQAKQRMIGANIRLVQSVAKKYMRNGLQWEDLVQEGCLGLVRGAEKFDPSKGYKFSTYAHWWVRQSITRAIQDSGRDVRLPVHLHELMTKVRSVQARLRQGEEAARNGCVGAEAVEEQEGESGKGRGKSKKKSKPLHVPEGSSVPTYVTIAKELDVEPERVASLMTLMENPVSFEQQVDGSDNKNRGGSSGGNSGNGATFEDILSDCDSAEDAPDTFAHRDQLRTDVKNLLNTLSKREREIVTLRYGVLENRQLTLEEIGSRYDVTRERIRQIESRALRKLRQPERCSIVLDYTEPSSNEQ